MTDDVRVIRVTPPVGFTIRDADRLLAWVGLDFLSAAVDAHTLTIAVSEEQWRPASKALAEAVASRGEAGWVIRGEADPDEWP